MCWNPNRSCNIPRASRPLRTAATNSTSSRSLRTGCGCSPPTTRADDATLTRSFAPMNPPIRCQTQAHRTIITATGRHTSGRPCPCNPARAGARFERAPIRFGGSLMQRASSRSNLSGQGGRVQERHDEIWPELVELIQSAGLKNYSLFRRGTQIIAYVECHPDIAKPSARWAVPKSTPAGRNGSRT